jgi:hypothetical protein
MNRTTEPRSRALASLLVPTLAVASAALVSGALLAGLARAVDVSGTLRVREGFGEPDQPSADDERRDRYWDEWNGFRDPSPRGFDPAVDLAVVLTGEGPMAEDQPGFEIAGGGLAPSTLVARGGGDLSIVNTDPTPHQLYAEGHEEFGPTATAPGLARRVPIAATGDWPIRDRLYHHVAGHLHVIDDLVARGRTVEDPEQPRQARYRFENVPPGSYTLKVFHGAELVHEQPVVVPEGRELTVEPIALPGGGS